MAWKGDCGAVFGFVVLIPSQRPIRNVLQRVQTELAFGWIHLSPEYLS